MEMDLREESGMSLIESMMAVLILLAGLLMMAQVLTVSVIASKTHGRDSGKTTIAARDKMEELKALSFSDTALADTGTESNDYLNADGTAGSSTSAVYTRAWQVTNVSGNQKRIRVTVTGTKSFKYGQPPSTTLVTDKTNPGN